MIIALNNKSNLGKEEFKNYLEELNKLKTSHKMILFPNYLNISKFNSNNILLGSQDISENASGPFTGEVSAKELKSYNVSYTLVGHSERREYENETEDQIQRKVLKALEYDITPILCIGETLEERNNNKVKEKLMKSIMTINSLSNEFKNKIIIAYEPIWSIGTGNTPKLDELEKVIDFIKSELPNNRILYGGSVNEKNIDYIQQIKKIDGYLLGGLSLHPDKLSILLDKLK